MSAIHRGRPWLRATRQRAVAGCAGLKPWLIEHTGCAGLTALARADGYPQNFGLLGVYDFKGDAARYRSLLANGCMPPDMAIC